MALLLNIFYGIFRLRRHEPDQPDQQEAAIQKLRETEEMLKKKQESLEKSIQRELLTAMNDRNATNKLAAVQALKRKKRYEKQVEQIEGKISNVESQREALENANVYTKVLKNMAFAAKAMQSIHANMDVDNVDDQIQAITEQQEMAQDISDVISKPMGPGEVFDEDELLAELEEMKRHQRLADKKLLEAGGTPPSAATAFLPAESVSLPEADGTLPCAATGPLPAESVSLPEADDTLPCAASAPLPAESISLPETDDGTLPCAASASSLPAESVSLLATNCNTERTQQHTDNAPDEPVLKKPRLDLRK